MSMVTLVRHGKAADFMSGDYDRLSEPEKRQARLLGEYWTGWGHRFDAVYMRPLRRHRETMDIVGHVYQERGLPWPEPIELKGFNEHGGLAVFHHALPLLMEEDEEIREAFLARGGSQRGSSGGDESFQTKHAYVDQ